MKTFLSIRKLGNKTSFCTTFHASYVIYYLITVHLKKVHNKFSKQNEHTANLF